jgi:FkbM family methyltransferase
MTPSVQSFVASALANITEKLVYVQKTGLTAGLKRRGGFGFLPRKKPLTLEHAFLKALDLTGKTIYDVGGHIGLMSMFFARKVGATGQIVTFEPNPQNRAAIDDHIQLNGFENIRVLQIGLGSKRETLQFVVTGSALGTADPQRQSQYLKQKNAQTFEIDVDTMDNLITTENLPKPDWIKIDVEGLEIDVLRGMEQTIKDHQPELFIELHGKSEEKVVEFLLSHNYRIRQVEDDHELTYQNIDEVRGHLYAQPN